MKWLIGAVSIRLCGNLVWVLAGFQTVVVSAAEVATFRLTDFHGFLETRQLYDQYLTQSIDAETKTTEPKSQREVGLTTNSYIYHPNMLNMDISGSLLLDNRSYTLEQTSSFTQTETETDNLDLTWNFAGSFRFLEKKPYPLTLFYNRQNPLVSGGLTETYTQENNDYGFSLGLRPLGMDIRARRTTRQGESAFQIVDDTVDIIDFKAKHRFLNGALVDFDYNLTNLNSISGSPNLPIQARSYIDQRFNLNSRWKFGNQNQYYFTQLASLYKRDDPERLDSRFSPTFRWTHSPRLESYYRYDFSSTALPGDADSLRHAGNALLLYKPSERLQVDLEARTEYSEEASNSLLRDIGFATIARYHQPVSVSVIDGTLTLSGGFDYDRFDQQANINQIDIIDESHTLTGTTPETLAREFVNGTSIVVTNTAGTQTFLENLDYQLTVIGSQTQLRRLVAGNILDGQAVLVSYVFDPGGTFNYSILGTTFNADLALARYYNLFLRYNDRIQSLESGSPTIQLNSVRTVEFGARADVPLPWWGMSAGGETRFRYQQEDISPFDSTNTDIYLQLPLPYRSTLRLSAYRALVNNDNSPEGTNLTRFTAQLSSRPWHRLNLTASANHEIDTGGRLEIRINDARLVANWQYRKMRISAEAIYSQQIQGDIERDRLTAFLTIRRDLW
jgi:hypothetical protein